MPSGRFKPQDALVLVEVVLVDEPRRLRRKSQKKKQIEMASRWSHRQSRQPLGPSTPLDGGDDEDGDTGTDTPVPDDDNDIASSTNQETTAIHTPTPNPSGPARAGARGSSRRQRGQFLTHSPTLSISNVKVYTQRAILQAPPTVPQLTHRQRGARLLRALMVKAVLPRQTCEFTLSQRLTQGWSNAVAERITHADLHSPPQLLEACAAPS